MNKEQIVVSYEPRFDELSIATQFNAEMERLHTFHRWTYDSEKHCFCYASRLANRVLFVNLGGVQLALMNIAFFDINPEKEPHVSLQLSLEVSPYDVINRLKEIGSIVTEKE